MQNNQDKIRVKEFISIASQLALDACKIIKQASQNKHLKKYQKAQDDPVTEADYHVQTMIINGLSRFFPKLKVIGEETVDYKGKIHVDYETFHFNLCPQNTQFQNLQIPVEQLCVWIDPIDCTKGFIQGKMQYVTTLIGMSRNQQAYIGVVGAPFRKAGQGREYYPCVNIGVVQTKQAFVYSEKSQWTPLKVQPLHNPLLITTSRNRVNNVFNNLTEYLNGKNVFAGGSGKKIMMVINGQVDVLAYIASYTAKWDSCAGQAIIKAMGGYFLTQKQQAITYDANSTNYENSDGQICTLNKQLFQKVFQFFQKNQTKL